MRGKLATNGRQQATVHYVNSPVVCMVEENSGRYYHNQGTLDQSSQRNSQSHIPRTFLSYNSETNQKFGQHQEEENSSETMNIEIQLEVDEALARELQEMENQLAGTSLGETAGTQSDTSSTGSSIGNAEGSLSNTSSLVSREDDVDLDNMTYEELQSLTEAIGTESRGLPDELISYLPSSTYKTGLFSRKDKRDECVICCMAYKNRDKLIKLPCQHQYHKGCIARWLKISKACPVCNEDVFGS